MANDLLGGLGGLMKGLSGFMPQDDPAVKMLNAQTEYTELLNKEEAQLAAIGRMAVEKYGTKVWGNAGEKLELIQQNLREAKQALEETKSENEQMEQEKKALDAERTCPNCGHMNPEGMKFCQECGSKVGSREKKFCPECGCQLEEGVRFCGECGHRLEEA